MKTKEFNELFPRLKEQDSEFVKDMGIELKMPIRGRYFSRITIQNHCLDKSRVQKLIENWQPKKITGVYKGSYIEARLTFEYWLALEDIKQELNLEGKE